MREFFFSSEMQHKRRLGAFSHLRGLIWFSQTGVHPPLPPPLPPGIHWAGLNIRVCIKTTAPKPLPLPLNKLAAVFYSKQSLKRFVCGVIMSHATSQPTTEQSIDLPIDPQSRCAWSVLSKLHLWLAQSLSNHVACSPGGACVRDCHTGYTCRYCRWGSVC